MKNLHITFLENKPNVAGKGPTWLFDLDYLTDSMNYHPVSSENQANLHAGQQEANQNAGTEEIIDSGDSEKENESAQDCFVLPIWPSYSSPITPALTTDDKREGPREEEQVFMDELERLKKQEKEAYEEAEALRKKFETLVLVDLPYGKKAIGTKWVYRNKKDERGVVVRNKARLEAIRSFLGLAHIWKGFWNCLRIMFEEPLSTDSIWSEIGQQKIISWRYYDTCRVHCLNLESMDVYMLSDRKYPLSAEVCKTMLKMKLLDGKMSEDCYRLLKMMEKQAGIRK
ncbi:hypothetical protein Tco_0105171 [Tanacetum coccineum]